MKPTRYLLLILLTAALLSGCAMHNIAPTGGADSSKTLSRGEKAYVAIPADVHFGSATYNGSGRKAATMLKAAISSNMSQVITSDKEQLCKDSFGPAQEEGAKYLFCPVIQHWEDRNTAWSGKPDRIELEISAYDVATKTLLNSVVLTANSQVMTLMNNPPEALLAKPLDQYANAYFR